MFWKKKDKSASETSTTTTTTNPFESDGASYSTRSSEPSGDSGYSAGGGRYGTRRQESDQTARNELLGSVRQPMRRYDSDPDDAYATSRFAPSQQEQEDEEIGNIKQQIRNVKQDSLASTRNALQKLHETEATAANTMNMLGQQSSELSFFLFYR